VESIESGVNTTAPRGSIFGPPVQNFFQIGFDAVWELDLFGKLRRGQEAAFDEWEAVQMQAQDVLITTISEVVHQYITIRSLQEQIALLEKKIDVARRNDLLFSFLQQAGIDSQRPVAVAAMDLEQEYAKMPVLETSYKQNIYALAVLLGKQPEELLSTFTATATLPLAISKVPAGLPSELLRRRPDIRAAERKLAAATARIGVAIADFFPKVSLTGTGYGYESNQQNNWLVPSARYWTIGPAIQWNLLDFGRTRAQVATANAQQKEALLFYEKTIITSLQDVEGALVAYFDEQVRYQHLIQEKEIATSLYQMTQDVFQAGLADEMQMLETLKGVFDKEDECIKSRAALANDMVALYKALGGQWECLAMP
jgi:NodT family efflux transporter outer membrane factor (OMF) lipoprotein